MKKNNLFLFISILTLVILLGTAATCNMCGMNISTETTSSTVVDTETASTSSEATETKETVAESTDKETVKDSTEEKSAETDKSTATESKGEAPTIKLQIYEGPTYSQTDNVCYYRIKAIVTGSPDPTVTFSKDDSNSSFGSKKVQVNLTKSSPNYTLTAKAKNSAGEATASIALSWGCGPLNSPPVIDKITIASPILTNTAYDVSVTASDPDGDSLSYEWTVNDGVLKGSESNPVKWATPDKAGTYKISVKVSDGKGGEDSESIDIDVKQASTNLNLNHVAAQEGYATSTKGSSNDMIVAGDHNNNTAYRGFMSFDIANLTGATIQNATLTLNLYQQVGDLSNFDQLWISVVDYGTNPLAGQDYDLSGIPIQSFPANGGGNITCNSSNLKTQLQNAVNAGKTRFQLRIHLSLPTDGDNTKDWLDYRTGGITLNVTFLK